MILDRLRELAEAAWSATDTAGEWYWEEDLREALRSSAGPNVLSCDAAFIAAVSPDALLRLVDVAEAATDVAIQRSTTGTTLGLTITSETAMGRLVEALAALDGEDD